MRKRVARPIVERVADAPKPRYTKPVMARTIDRLMQLHDWDYPTAKKHYISERMKLDKVEL